MQRNLEDLFNTYAIPTAIAVLLLASWALEAYDHSNPIKKQPSYQTSPRNLPAPKELDHQ